MSTELNNKFNGIIVQLEKEYGEKMIAPQLKKVAALVKTAINTNFAKRGQWDGSGTDLFSGGMYRWKPYAKSTIRSRVRKGYPNSGRPTLIMSSKMKQSIQVNDDGVHSIRITSNSPYAAIQNYGGEIEMKAREGEVRLKKVKNKDTGKSGYNFAKKNAKNKSILTRKFKKKAYQIKIPARPFVTLTPKDVDQIIKACMKLLES